MRFLNAHCKSEKSFTNHFVHLLPPLLPQSLFLKLRDGEWVVIYSPEVSEVPDSGLGVECLPEFLSAV